MDYLMKGNELQSVIMCLSQFWAPTSDCSVSSSLGKKQLKKKTRSDLILAFKRLMLSDIYFLLWENPKSTMSHYLSIYGAEGRADGDEREGKV